MSQEKIFLSVVVLSIIVLILSIVLADCIHSFCKQIKQVESRLSELRNEQYDMVKRSEVEYVLKMAKHHEFESILSELNAQEFTEHGQVREKVIEEIMDRLFKVAPPLTYRVFNSNSKMYYRYLYRGDCGEISITIYSPERFTVDVKWK